MNSMVEATSASGGPMRSGETDRLESWKDVAAYLKRDVSTVQRWEKNEGLPVRRHQHEKLASIYAFKSEIDAWLLRRSRLEEPCEDKWAGDPSMPTPTITSLVVLPFANLSPNAGEDFLSDGMTEALISALARIRAVRVISRTSAMRYKGTAEALPRIAHRLGVDAVVEGSVVRDGERVRVTVRVIHAGTDSQLWSGNFERGVCDVLTLQDETARAIAEEIRITITAQRSVRC
jgi:TolB-like protein